MPSAARPLVSPSARPIAQPTEKNLPSRVETRNKLPSTSFRDHCDVDGLKSYSATCVAVATIDSTLASRLCR